MTWGVGLRVLILSYLSLSHPPVIHGFFALSIASRRAGTRCRASTPGIFSLGDAIAGLGEESRVFDRSRKVPIRFTSS